MTALKNHAERLFPGLLIAGLVAITAQFLSEHYGAPAMLMAILLGVSLQYLSEEPRTAPGVAFGGKTLLRIGVALLGVRVSVEMVTGLGPFLVALTVAGVVVTIGFSLIIAPLFGRARLFGFLTGGAVAICGASAAMAISSVLPKNENSEQDLAFTVVIVTVLSTVAMIFYPILGDALGLDLRQMGVFLGGTIHDVAQVVGAGYTVSDETGELATVVKLIRVTMLAPVVLVASVLLRNASKGAVNRPPIMPGFVVAFLVLAALNSMHLLPQILVDWASVVSRWALLTAIAAVGMKTSIPKLLNVGGPAIGMLVVQTVFLAVFILAGALLLG